MKCPDINVKITCTIDADYDAILFTRAHLARCLKTIFLNPDHADMLANDLFDVSERLVRES